MIWVKQINDNLEDSIIIDEALEGSNNWVITIREIQDLITQKAYILKNFFRKIFLKNILK